MPHLQDHHQSARVIYSVANLDIVSGQYHDYFALVHVDEKWFFLTEAQLSLYLVPGELVPERLVRHKSHILKVMFLAAIARPGYNDTDVCTLDGKIGIWPFVERVTARRTSVRRPAGTIETKLVNVTSQKYKVHGREGVACYKIKMA
jgi:hypothetical protein